MRPTLLALALVGSLFAACGGKTAVIDLTGTGSSGGSSGGSGGSSGAPSGGSSASSSGGSSGSSGDSSGSSIGCVDINPADFDQTCNYNSDCSGVTTGTICPGACDCGGWWNTAINVSGTSRYQAEVAPVVTAIGACVCPPPHPPVCSGHQCVICHGTPSDPPECGSNCPDIPTTLLASPTCAAAGCHNSNDKIQGLDLQSPGLASRLVGVMATEGPGLLIDPSNPSASVLYTKETAMPPFGARMPLGEPPLDDATLACLLAWVTQQPDSVISIDASVGVVCKGLGSSGSATGGGVCSLQASETCSDGTNYTASCTCPDAVCTCTESRGNMGGSSGGGMSFMGCANDCGINNVPPEVIDIPLAFQACGFPLPQ